MIGSARSRISSGISSGISFLRAWSVSKDLAKRHPGTKQLATDRPDRSAQYSSGLCGGEFTKRDEHDHLSLASGKATDGSDEVGVDPGFGRWRAGPVHHVGSIVLRVNGQSLPAKAAKRGASRNARAPFREVSEPGGCPCVSIEWPCQSLPA